MAYRSHGCQGADGQLLAVGEDLKVEGVKEERVKEEGRMEWLAALRFKVEGEEEHHVL